MRRPIRSVAILCLSLAMDTAGADDSGWYVGIGIGDVTGNYSAADFDDGSIREGSVDNSDSAWRLFGGIEINRHFAMEAGYVDLHNDVDLKRTFSGLSDGDGSRFVSFPEGEVSVDIDNVTGAYIKAIGSLPLTARFSLGSGAGVVIWDARQTTIDLNPYTSTLDGTDMLIGVGMEYQFDNGIAIRGDVERYFDVGGTDQDLAVLSVLYLF